jgi:hypothetical protein
MTTVCCTDLILALEMPFEVSSKYLDEIDESVEAVDIRGFLPSTIAEEGTLVRTKLITWIGCKFMVIDDAALLLPKFRQIAKQMQALQKINTTNGTKK